MGGVMEVPYDGCGLPSTVLCVELQQGGNRGTDDPPRCLHHPIQLLFFPSCAAAEPGGEAVGRYPDLPIFICLAGNRTVKMMIKILNRD